MTHNNEFLGTSTASSNMEPIVLNARALTLPPRSIYIISGLAPTELNTKHLYQLDAADDLPSGIISLAMYHKIDHRQQKLLKISLLNIEQDTVHILRKTIKVNLQ